LRQGVTAGASETQHGALADAVERLSAAADAIGAGARASSDAFATGLREIMAHTAAEPGAGAARIEPLRAAVEALTVEVQQLAGRFAAARGTSAAGEAATGGTAAEIGRELQKLLAEI
jgi:hypothetical protein